MTCKQCKYITVCMAQADGLGQVFDPNYDGEHGCTDFVPFTNADSIRAMTDDELAKWLDNFFWGHKKVNIFNIRKWLQQPAEKPKEESEC